VNNVLFALLGCFGKKEENMGKDKFL